MTLLTPRSATSLAEARPEVPAEPVAAPEEPRLPDPAQLPSVIGGVLTLMLLSGFLVRFL